MLKLMCIHHSGLVGGAGVSFINTVKTVAEGNEVVVYVPSEPKDIYQMLKGLEAPLGIRVETYGRRIGAVTYYSGGDGVCKPRFWYRVGLILKQWRYWNTVIERENPDRVIVNSQILCWMGSLKSVRHRQSVCFVRETLNGSPRRPVNRLIARLLDRFNTVIFLSDHDKTMMGLKRANAEVVHNYVQESQFDIALSRADASKMLGLSEDTFHVLYVGGVSHMKGFDLCVDAVLKAGKAVELIVAGNDFADARVTKDKNVLRYVDKWQAAVRERDTHGQIHMLGRQRDMSACYAACDVLAFPMRSPHQSRPAFEAGYFGKPVIISAFDSIAEFVRSSDNGITVAANDVAALTRAIERLAADAALCRQLGENNRKNTQRLHDRTINCGRIKEILEFGS